MSDKKPVIIKKIKKGGHGGHHGGAWKIAYADFVTAMMAFFLLMWLLNSTSKETKEQLSIFFQEYSVFEGMPKSLGVGSGGRESSVQDRLKPIMMEGTVGMYAEGKSQEEELKEAMSQAVEEKLAAYKDEIVIDTIESGVRIQMLESGKPFFTSGSSIPTEDARKVLKVIADTVRDMQQQVAVEGHTDSIPLGGPSSRYTNWELSTDRASAARLVLEEYGVSPKRMLRVAGYAATQPLIKENPADPRNRRVSILLFNPQGAGKNPEAKPLSSGNGLMSKPLAPGSEGLVLPNR